jgi:hypothetical protein
MASSMGEMRLIECCQVLYVHLKDLLIISVALNSSIIITIFTMLTLPEYLYTKENYTI